MNKETSVIIPFFDETNLLKRAIKSVLDQTYKNIEIIIINDNPDKKHEILETKKKFNSKYIKYIFNKRNIGPGLSRNRGILVAKGKYIAFLDSDDFWNKNKLLNQINFMKKNNVKICHTSYGIFDIHNNFLSKRIAKDMDYYDLVKSCDIGMSTVVVERKLINRYPFPDIKTKEDYVVWLKISKNGFRIHGLNQILTRWTSRKNSLSKSNFQKLKDGFKVYNIYEKKNFFKSLIYLVRLSLNYLKKK
jgi:teichuronic acid biosynthesis glycosyltransferase TuaG